ncbi:MAG: hypothetical protein KBS96_01555 [Lachnospiraceae bacterium]|nr:hypothetical protein [Candidatus Colinaster scatohippi]
MFFKTKAEKKLDEIITGIDMNMSNNYKDNAQSGLRDLEKALVEMKENGELKEKALGRYEGILKEYQEKMKGYSHKDQKPYWT